MFVSAAVSLKQHQSLHLCSFPFIVKCIKNTPAYFAERLHKAMQVHLLFIITFYSKVGDFTAIVNEVTHCVNREQGPRTQPSSE